MSETFRDLIDLRDTAVARISANVANVLIHWPVGELNDISDN